MAFLFLQASLAAKVETSPLLQLVDRDRHRSYDSPRSLCTFVKVRHEILHLYVLTVTSLDLSA